MLTQTGALVDTAGAHAEERISLLRQPDWSSLAPDQAAQFVAELPD